MVGDRPTSRRRYTDPLDEADAPPQKSNSGGKKAPAVEPGGRFEIFMKSRWRVLQGL